MDYSQITEMLAIVASPIESDAPELVDRGIRLVLAMNHKRPPASLGRPPLRLLHLPTSDSPFLPMPMDKLHAGVRAALPVIEAGDGVAVYCNKGRHRSVAMACCILIAQGYPAAEAMALVKQQRAAADPHIWYIRGRIRKFERQWLSLKREED